MLECGPHFKKVPSLNVFWELSFWIKVLSKCFLTVAQYVLALISVDLPDNSKILISEYHTWI